jgi:hypothetical protein
MDHREAVFKKTHCGKLGDDTLEPFMANDERIYPILGTSKKKSGPHHRTHNDRHLHPRFAAQRVIFFVSGRGGSICVSEWDGDIGDITLPDI